MAWLRIHAIRVDLLPSCFGLSRLFKAVATRKRWYTPDAGWPGGQERQAADYPSAVAPYEGALILGPSAPVLEETWTSGNILRLRTVTTSS